MSFKSKYIEMLKQVKKMGRDNLQPNISTTSKLAKHGIVSFGLVADINCPAASLCKDFCYAKFGSYSWNGAMKNRVENFIFTLDKDFADIMTVAIKLAVRKNKATVFRIHDSGDFYSQKYLNDWTKIIENLPSVYFYAYTKSLHLNLGEIAKLENFGLIQSKGGSFDHLINPKWPIADVFQTKKDLESAGYMDASVDEMIAVNGSHRIGFIAHGAGRRRV